jgi:ribosomal 50S subunit-associated protein YjgA (DUF615 family)
MDTALAEIIAMVLIVTIVGVLLVSIPITRRLGRALEEWIRIRSEGAAGQVQIDQLSEQVRALSRHIETIEGRMEFLSERQEFTESLVDSRSGVKSIPADGS